MLAAQPGLAQAPLSTAGPLGALHPGPFSIRLTPTSLGIENLQVPNPLGFRGGALARVARATVRFDCSKMVGWRLRLEEVSVELAELTLVKNEKGHMNIDAFKWVPLPGVFIDKLDVKIGKIILVDHSAAGDGQATEIQLDFHERYERVTGLSHLIGRVWEATFSRLKRATAARISFLPFRILAMLPLELAKSLF